MGIDRMLEMIFEAIFKVILFCLGIDFRAVDKVIDGLKIRVQLW